VFTIEMLMIDWDDRDNPSVVQRIPSYAPGLGEAVMFAKSILDDARRAPPNAYWIRDDDGKIVLRSWERSL
jgi:hypothetical protein